MFPANTPQPYEPPAPLPHPHPAGTPPLSSISSGRAGIPRPPRRAAPGTPAPGRPAPAVSPLPGPGIARTSPPPLAPRGAGSHPRVPGPGRMGPSAGGAAEVRQDTAPAPASGNGRRGSDRRYRAGRSWGRCPGEAPASRRREGRDGGRERCRPPSPAHPTRSILRPPEPLAELCLEPTPLPGVGARSIPPAHPPGAGGMRRGGGHRLPPPAAPCPGGPAAGRPLRAQVGGGGARARRRP